MESPVRRAVGGEEPLAIVFQDRFTPRLPHGNIGVIAEHAPCDYIVSVENTSTTLLSPEVFARQMAGVNTFCPKYNWIYGHGCVFWQWSEEEKARYESSSHRAVSNATLPTVANVADYTAVIARPGRVTAVSMALPPAWPRRRSPS